MSSKQLAAPQEFVHALRQEVEGRSFGRVEVQELIPLWGEDADGTDALYLDFTLSDPEGPTWPYEDTVELRRRIREISLDHPPGMMFYVTLRPVHEEPQAEEEEDIAAEG